MSYQVKVDLNDVLVALDAAVKDVFPQMSQAVQMVAEHGANEWRSRVAKARLWNVEKQRYIESIQWRMVNPLSAEIWTDYNLADEIEKGRPSRDLKKMLQTSKKVRLSKSKSHNGQRYLLIPFRHNVPGNDALAMSMPSDIYAVAKHLEKSQVLTPGSKKPATRLSASGHTVPQQSYKWGGRLPAGLAPKMKPHHKTDIYAGMVRMNTSAGKAKSSAYLTFRTMGEWSSGWIVPPKPGLFIARDVAGDLELVLEKAIGKVVSMNTKDLFK
ncbi:MAG: hypothetical protein IBX56_17650 [Methylomicrobium sp.]|nr:hypothetical protein [Methylomicrobium sp.]